MYIYICLSVPTMRRLPFSYTNVKKTIFSKMCRCGSKLGLIGKGGGGSKIFRRGDRLIKDEEKGW